MGYVRCGELGYAGWLFGWMCWVGLVGSSQCGVGCDFWLECGVRLEHGHGLQQGVSKIKIKVIVFKHCETYLNSENQQEN